MKFYVLFSFVRGLKFKVIPGYISKFEVTLGYMAPCLKTDRQTDRQADEIAQWLRALAALSEDPGLVPRFYKFTTVYKSSSSGNGSKVLLWPLQAPGLPAVHIHAEDCCSGHRKLPGDFLFTV